MASFKTSGTEVCGDTPVGALTAYCGNFVFSTTNQIDGWVLCDGATYSNTDGRYNTLISMSIGSSSGSNYLSPNLTGRMPLGRDAATNNTSNTGGSNNKTLSIAEYPSHTHDAIVSAHGTTADHTHVYQETIVDRANNTVNWVYEGTNRALGYITSTTTDATAYHTHSVTNSGNIYVPPINAASGNSQPFSILNQHVGVRWLLKY